MKIVVIAGVLISALLTAPGFSADATFLYRDALVPGHLLDIRPMKGGIRVLLAERLEIRARRTSGRGSLDTLRIATHSTAAGMMVCIRYAGDAADACGDCDLLRPSAGGGTRADFMIGVSPPPEIGGRRLVV